jgi:hypothetical protein
MDTWPSKFGEAWTRCRVLACGRICQLPTSLLVKGRWRYYSVEKQRLLYQKQKQILKHRRMGVGQKLLLKQQIYEVVIVYNNAGCRDRTIVLH